MTTSNRTAKSVSMTYWTRRLSRFAATGPWFDPIALYSLKRWMFPLSRMWAAANISNGDVDAFLKNVPIDGAEGQEQRITAALLHTDEARLIADATDQHWTEIFFAGAKATNHQRILSERARRGRRHAFYATRRHFRFLSKYGVPTARQRIDSPDDIEQKYGGLVSGDKKLAPLPTPFPKIDVSQPIDRDGFTEHWLRFSSPSEVMGDQVLAHVYTPKTGKNPPTLIFRSGICVETEHWRGLLDEVKELVAGGVRVIRPEAPWHGYRTPPGYYGGERLIETFPSGTLDAFSAAIQETAVLADWAKQTSSGPLAFGGTSLGALMAQCAADSSQDWPRNLHPDALFLITHTGNILEAIMHGDLTKLWGNPEHAEAAGWDVDRAAQYLNLLNPGPYAAVPGKNIVSVLGNRDRVTPFASGKLLLDRWGVPEHNRFLWWRGHFSVPTTLVHNSKPVHHFCKLMHALS